MGAQRITGNPKFYSLIGKRKIGCTVATFYCCDVTHEIQRAYRMMFVISGALTFSSLLSSRILTTYADLMRPLESRLNKHASGRNLKGNKEEANEEDYCFATRQHGEDSIPSERFCPLLSCKFCPGCMQFAIAIEQTMMPIKPL